MSDITEINAITGETTTREYTADEQAQRAKDEAKHAELAEAEKARAQARSEVLAKLGLTADEVAALLS